MANRTKIKSLSYFTTMEVQMELYEVNVEYVKYLRKFEPTKIMSIADGKEQRKFLGVIVQKNGYKYVIPLSSPKYKKDYKIRDYQGDNLPEALLQKQVQFIRKNQENILKKHANVVYVNRKKGRTDIGYIKNATPDFDLLEAKCDEWIRNDENKK